MDLKGVLRVQDTTKNELVAEEAAEEGMCSVLVVVVVAVEALDQAVIHIDMEKNCTIGKNYSEKAIVGLGVDKVMDVVVAVAVEWYCMMSYYHRKIEDCDYSATVAEVEKLVYPSRSKRKMHCRGKTVTAAVAQVVWQLMEAVENLQLRTSSLSPVLQPNLPAPYYVQR